ncbi:MAG TPA: hypothetical protein DEO82_05915 [Eubacterium sp.]|nr:hypothetical protein [Eubacterium sp.]
MTYENLYTEFISLFPEDIEYFKKKEEETGADIQDGIHVVFGMVVVPYVIMIVQEAPDKAMKAFEFFEKMEKSGDSRIAEVVEFTVLENLLSEEKGVISQCAGFFGEETRKAADDVGKWAISSEK